MLQEAFPDAGEAGIELLAEPEAALRYYGAEGWLDLILLRWKRLAERKFRECAHLPVLGTPTAPRARMLESNASSEEGTLSAEKRR